jgi:tetratricopeptide (TPR) repeat protein/Cdc6-like AAA superfamily ATPase
VTAVQSAPLDRQIRVFVSSTFRDMQEERDELAKRTFPALRRLCEQRGVAWTDVDLRWGVTREEAAEGKVLPVCLAEIHRCRPYFIGLLGERYGWVPMTIPDELIEGEPWLTEHREKSITELEILHGVLNDPAMAARAFFYFRDPAYVDRLPGVEQAAHREVPALEEVAVLGEEEAERRSQQRRERLGALKERIRSGHRDGVLLHTPHENYADPRSLGQGVLEDFTKLLDELFPETEVPSPLDRDAADHEAFAASRRQVYVPREADLKRLDEHAAGTGAPLVVLGESGSGKTALLSNWVKRWRASHDDVPVNQHYIGATPQSTDWAALVRRIMAELDRRFTLGLEIPSAPHELRLAFAQSLYRAAAQGRVVLVLDALNQLEDRDQAPDLVWLPPELPSNVRLVVSTLPGHPLASLEERGWPTFNVVPLSPEERRELIVRYVAEKHGGRLAPQQLERIATAPQSANPLFLITLLEELRVHGAHEQLGERIAHYLEADTVPALYARVLARWESDYERDRPDLVGDAMRLLWAARRGLSEGELLALLGTADAPLPHAYWSPLHMAVWEALLSRSGLLGFFHDGLRLAVEERYLGEVGARRAAHIALADYFARDRLEPRSVDELPWQLTEAGDQWERLADLLANLEFFDRAWDRNEFEVKTYWASIEAKSDRRIVETYGPIALRPEEHGVLRNHRVLSLLGDTGHPEEALRIQSHLTDRFRRLGDPAGLQASLGNQALILKAKGDLDGAMALHKEKERLCRQLGDPAGLQASLGNQALIHQDRGDLDGAIALLKEQERICRELGDPAGLQASLGNQALILKAKGDLDGAMALHAEEERICRQMGDPAGLQASLGNQALILQVTGDLDGAMALH